MFFLIATNCDVIYWKWLLIKGHLIFSEDDQDLPSAPNNQSHLAKHSETDK